MPFRDIIAQDRVCNILDRLIQANLSFPLLFVGQPGIGKRTVAIKLAQTVNCERRNDVACDTCNTCQQIARLTHPEVRIIIPTRKPSATASPSEIIAEMIKHYPDYTLDKPQPSLPPNFVIPIGTVRWLSTEMAKPPVYAKKRFYIILNAHHMKYGTQNALLKILEEPQINTVFVLTTTNSTSLLSTIRSRCQTIRFANIPENEISKYLTAQLQFQSNNRKPEYDNHIDHQQNLLLATALAQGSLGRALAILKNPETIICQQLIDLISKEGLGYPSLYRAFEELNTTSPTFPSETALAICYNTLHSRIGCSFLPILKSPILYNLSVPLLIAKLLYFYHRFHQNALNLNPSLGHYTTISNIFLRHLISHGQSD